MTRFQDPWSGERVRLGFTERPHSAVFSRALRPAPTRGKNPCYPRRPHRLGSADECSGRREGAAGSSDGPTSAPVLLNHFRAQIFTKYMRQSAFSYGISIFKHIGEGIFLRLLVIHICRPFTTAHLETLSQACCSDVCDRFETKFSNLGKPPCLLTCLCVPRTSEDLGPQEGVQRFIICGSNIESNRSPVAPRER